MREKKRDTLAIYRDVLDVITRFPNYKISRLGAIAGINNGNNHPVFDLLLTHGFITERDGKYTLTQKGYHWKNQYTELERQIGGCALGLNPQLTPAPPLGQSRGSSGTI